MDRENLKEQLLWAWIRAKGILKDSKVTEAVTYNEAAVMNLIYDRYRQDGVGRTAVSDILRQTNMLKSLLNRTVNALCKRGWIRRERGAADGRSLFVCPVEEELCEFLKVHRQSLALAERIVDVVGREDAEAFVRMVEKLDRAGLRV